MFRRVRPPTHRGDSDDAEPLAGLTESRRTLVERYMIDAEEADARAQGKEAEASSAQTPKRGVSADGRPAAGTGRRDVEETGSERKRQTPELVGDGAVDAALAAEGVGELVGVERPEGTSPGLVGSGDAPARALDERAGDGFGNLAEQADELAEGEGSTLGGGAVEDGTADVRLLESEHEVGRGNGTRGERSAAMSGEVDAPPAGDRARLGKRRRAVEVERSGGGHVNGKAAGELSHQGGGEGASEAVSRADESEGETVVYGSGLPPAEEASTRPDRPKVRATLARQTASRSRRTRSPLQRDGIPADSDSRVMTEAFPNRPTSLADYLEILRRRIWIVLIPVILAPLLTYVISKRQTPVYSASSSVVFNFSSATSQALGLFNPNAQDPTSYLQTQAVVARKDRILKSVARSHNVSPGELYSSSSIAPSPIANLLVFTVQTGDPNQAAALANAYASRYTRFRAAQDVQGFKNAIRFYGAKLRSLRAQHKSTAAVDTQTTLAALQAGLAAYASYRPQIAQSATGGAQVSPRPKRDALLGLALGLALGVGLAFLAEALDKRVRSEREIEDILGLPLLARLPKPSRRLRRARELPILAEPRGASAEAVKKLRTNLEFQTLEHEARVIMVTSALEQEGKSTTIASLAVALARSGRRVALVDLDLRKPFLHRFFRISQGPGVIDIVSGDRELAAVLKPVLLPGSNRRGSGQGSSVLAVLPAGPIGVDDPAFLVSHPRVAEMIEQLKNDWDFVLIDAPPLPAVDDGLALSASVDGVLVVTRSGRVPRRMLEELSRLLDSSPAEVLGFVLTGQSRSEAYGYGYGYGSGNKSGKVDAAQMIEATTQDGGDGGDAGSRSRRAWSQR